MDERQTQPWKRRAAPLFSNCPPLQDWFRTALYCPRVIHANGLFRMWFVGADAAPLSYANICIGYAESRDGASWTLHPGNPLIRPDQLPWEATILSTPWVLFDEDEELYKMWLDVSGPVTERRASGFAVDLREKVAYATSADGLSWEFHPEPLTEGTRAPCVRKGEDGYRMWINGRPSPDDDHTVAYSHVFEYRSEDGVHWDRIDAPVITAGGRTVTCVYPCVLQVADAWFMWHIGHLKEREPPHYHPVEIFCDASSDGLTWRTFHHEPAFAAADDEERFDWKSVSTPCVIRVEDQLLMYYSAYNREGNSHRFTGGSDGRGAHFGLATMSVSELASHRPERPSTVP